MAYSLTLERSGRNLPAGWMSSVLMLSPSLSRTSPDRVAGSASKSGSAMILGPRTTSTLSASSCGSGMMKESVSSTTACALKLIGLSVGGTVTTPVRADAAATSGLTRCTEASGVPERFGKLRLKVRSDNPLLIGEPPWPIQAPQPFSMMRTPEANSEVI